MLRPLLPLLLAPLFLIGSACAEVAAGTCANDSDCRVVADYCTSCDCRALGKNESLPQCPGPGVRCFADPCGNKVAKCQSGRCTAVDSGSK